MKSFKIDQWGPPRLRAIFKSIQDRINAITPLGSETTDVDEKPDGMQIIEKAWGPAPVPEGDVAGGGGGAGGTPVDLYGARDGAAAIFHLLQSSPPTAL